MAKRKNIRERGKIKFSRAFQDIKEGDSVSVIREEAAQPRFPKTLQGRTGIVGEKRGRSFIINIKDLNKEKKFIINPIHLKKLKQMKSSQ